MKGIKLVMFFLMFMLVVSLFLFAYMPAVFADFKLGNKSFFVQKVYGPEELIKGWLNISLRDIDSDSLLECNFGGSISIIDFLENNSASYSCFPDDCNSDYTASDGESSKSFSLSAGEKKTLGVKIEGQIESIDTFKFSVKGTSPQTCQPPLIIDILDDRLNTDDEDYAESIEYVSTNTTNDFSCSLNRTGCFELAKAENVDTYIRTRQYCETMRLPPSSKFKLGAWIKKGTTKFYSGLLRMELYSDYGGFLEKCDLPEPSSSGAEASCLINYTNPVEQDFAVCIIAKEITDYNIKTEKDMPCGFAGDPEDFEEYELDYYIFAEAAKFDSIGTFEFNESSLYDLNGNDLNDYVMHYISRYDGNCSEGCVIPITFLSAANAELEISNLFLGYSTTSRATSNNRIYNVEKKPAKINSGFLILQLDEAGFKAPKTYGNRTLIVELDGKDVVKEAIKVEKLPIIKSLHPLQAIAAQPTTFLASVSSPANRSIVKYTWDFGDNDSYETDNNTIFYTYYKVGSHKLKISAEDEDGMVGSREFSIEVGSPEEILNATLENKRRVLENITEQVEKMGWYQDKVKEILDLEGAEDSIRKLLIKYEQASSTEDYVSIMGNLTFLELPLFIEQESGNLPVYLFLDSIDLRKITQASGEDYEEEKEQMYVSAIANWMTDNLGVNINYKKVLSYYSDYIDTLLVAYEVDIKKKNEIPESFLIIESGDVTFRKKDVEQQFDNFASQNFSDDTKAEFFVQGIENLVSLPIYISPAISELNITEPVPCNLNKKCEKELGEDNENCPSDCRNWRRLMWYIILSFVGVFILYIILQEWYKRKYEFHLFKNKDDLYNLINFVSNATTQGLDEGEIMNRLKKQGWSGEQVVYALKKFKGKRTGMWEIPIFRAFEKKKIKKQLIIRQNKQIQS